MGVLGAASLATHGASAPDLFGGWTMKEPNIDAVVGEIGRTGMPCAVLLDGDTLTAFGPVFASEDCARRFLAYLERYAIRDPRGMRPDALADAHRRWLASEEADDGVNDFVLADTMPAGPAHQESP